MSIVFFQIGLRGDNALKVDERAVANDVKPDETKPLDVKPADRAANEELKKEDEPVKPGEGEVKRQEPPVPHAPKDSPAENAADQGKGREEVHLNEKRQLMSQREEDKSTSQELNVVAKEDKVDEAAARNVADANQVKISEREIDDELKKLEQPNKVI